MSVKVAIDGILMVAPDVYSVGSERIGEFERNANGRLVGDLVAVKAVVSCSWKMLSGADYARLINGGKAVFAQVDYFDVGLQAMVQREMYVKVGVGRLALVDEELWWKDVGCDFVER